jgi:16S rRNA (cytosine1402-N4)-methyltransferase
MRLGPLVLLRRTSTTTTRNKRTWCSNPGVALGQSHLNKNKNNNLMRPGTSSRLWTAVSSCPWLLSTTAAFTSLPFPLHPRIHYQHHLITTRHCSSTTQEDPTDSTDSSIFLDDCATTSTKKTPFATSYHAPVMWKECIDALLECERAQKRRHQTNDGIVKTTTPQNDDESESLLFIDGTLGGGGHSEALLQQLQPKDIVIGCDVDSKALQTASQRLQQYMDPNNIDKLPLFVPIQSNFAQLVTKLPRVMHPLFENSDTPLLQNGKLNVIDGILLDLGVSSYQIDTPERGFAFMADGPLDMRMSNHDESSSLTAADLCNELEEQELIRILKQFGDEPRAKVIAQSIIKHRPLSTTAHLQQAVADVTFAFDKTSKRKGRTATLARVFQALRIVVNQEDQVLQQVLEDVAPNLLRKGGRLVVLSYHSMEDRATKRVMRDGSIIKQRGSPLRDMYGNHIGPNKPFRPVGKFQKATDDEVALNSRARSATLRIAERLD